VPYFFLASLSADFIATRFQKVRFTLLRCSETERKREFQQVHGVLEAQLADMENSTVPDVSKSQYVFTKEYIFTDRCFVAFFISTRNPVL